MDKRTELVELIRKLSTTKEGRIVAIALVAIALAIGAYLGYDTSTVIDLACGAL